MSTIAIKYNGTNITDDVVMADAEFVSRTDANVGEAYFRVLDRKDGFYTKTYFKAGNEVTLDVDGVRVWGGYLESVTYDYPGAAWWVKDDTPRFFTLKCVDYNILFHRRVLWNKAKPTHQMKIYKASDNLDSDKQIIKDMVNLYLDLSGDGFEAGGSNVIDLTNVEELGEIYWKENCSTTWQAASPGMKWGDAMKHICAWSGAVFYIGAANPSQTHKGPTLYYHDVNSVTGPYELNDRPASSPGSAGVQNFEHIEDISQLATEALVWGAGMGSDEMVFHRETASDKVSEHIRFQWADFVTTMWLLECIKHRAKTYIHGSRQNRRGHKKPRETWHATIFTPDFMPGDVVDMESYVFGVQDNVPIREMKITFINPTDAKFELTMSHHMDTAYMTNMWWDADDPDGPPDTPSDPPPGGGYQNRWIYQTIPLGIGPIITPGPSNPPPPSNYHCNTGPEAVLVDKIRYWSDGTTQRLGPGFIPFDGNDDYGSYLERLGNHPWYNCVCPAIIGLGCWAGRWVKVQYWYQITIPAGFNNTLYVLGKKITYEGTPGDHGASLVTSQEEYDNFHNVIDDADKMLVPGIPASGGSFGGSSTHSFGTGANYLGGAYDPEITGETDYRNASVPIPDGHLPPLQEGTCAHYHWYSGCWGGYSYIPTFAVSDVPAGQNVWLVFTPGWDGDEIIGDDKAERLCDSSYYKNGVAGGQGPRAEGLGGSGGYDMPSTFQTMVCSGGSQGYAPTPDQNTGVGYYTGPTDKVYYTQFPYVPGSLEVYVNGIPYHGFVEMDPATGQFSVHVGGLYSYGSFDIRYMASSPDPIDHPGFPNEDDTGVNDTVVPDESGPEGGRIYRPPFYSTYGWQSEYDGSNVPFAAMSSFIARASNGTTFKNPVEVRSASGITTRQPISFSQMEDAITQFTGINYWYPGILNYENFRTAINEGRGAIVTGNPAYLGVYAPSTGLNTVFAGPHVLYVNEFRSDGWALVYDPAERTAAKGVKWIPPSVLIDYTATNSGSKGLVRSIMTGRTQRV